jgi:hypothetical protein
MTEGCPSDENLRTQDIVLFGADALEVPFFYSYKVEGDTEIFYLLSSAFSIFDRTFEMLCIQDP